MRESRNSRARLDGRNSSTLLAPSTSYAHLSFLSHLVYDLFDSNLYANLYPLVTWTRENNGVFDKTDRARERCTLSPRISIVYGTKYIEACFTSDTLPPSFLCCSLIDAHREKGIRASPRERGRERGETRKCVIYVYILDVGTVVAANKSRANRKREDGSETKSVRAREREREREREGRVSEGNLVIELANSLYCV